MTVPESLRYTKEHEWVRAEEGLAEGTVTVGVTDFAAESLGDVVFVALPPVGEIISAGQVCGEIESTKSVSNLYAPVSGEVGEVNSSVVDAPEPVNTDPFGEGWLCRIRTGGADGLLDAQAYAALIHEEV